MKRKRLTNLVYYFILILVSVFFFFPIYWQILTSLKYPGDITSYPPIWITSKLGIDNYKLLFGYTGSLWGQKGYVGRTFLANITPYLRNSLIVGFFSTTIALIFGASLAYGIVHFKFGGKNLYTWLLSLRMIPPVVVAIPLFILFKFFRIINTHEALIIAYLLFNTQTFPVYTTMFSQVERGTSWGPAAAGGVIGMIPMLVFSFYVQKYLARGLTAGAVK